MLSERQHKWIEAIVKLIRLTQKNQLKWHVETLPESLQHRGRLQDIKADEVYVSEIKGSQLRLSEISPRLMFKPMLSIFEQPKPINVVLEVINPIGGQITDKVSGIEGLDNLLETVQTSGVDNFLDEFLKDE